MAAVVCAAPCDNEQKLLRERFAALVTLAPGTTPCAIRADFNGDGTLDAALLVRLEIDPATVPSTIIRANPLQRSGAWTAKRKGLAIAVSFEGAAPKLFLLADDAFFSTPMWQSPIDLLSKIPRSKAPKAAKGDALGVATESGADMLVYWTGSQWRAEPSQETP